MPVVQQAIGQLRIQVLKWCEIRATALCTGVGLGDGCLGWMASVWFLGAATVKCKRSF
jgi:hypothetical protein